LQDGCVSVSQRQAIPELPLFVSRAALGCHKMVVKSSEIRDHRSSRRLPRIRPRSGYLQRDNPNLLAENSFHDVVEAAITCPVARIDI
jgi:hypothetical protein